MWTASIAAPKSIEARAEAFEAAGWTGMMVVDSQNISGDSYVALTLAARVTERLRLGTGVTNPLTRHPAVTASAIASVQVASDGRASLAIGRGDSALAHIGMAPAPVKYLEAYTGALRAYLHGQAVAFEELGQFSPSGCSRQIDGLNLADAPSGSSLRWAGAQPSPVPVEVVGSGPAVLAAAARVSDRVWVAVGAQPERVQWAISSVRAERDRLGLAPVPIGAVVNVVAHPDLDTARDLVAGGLASTARFSAMHGVVRAPVAEADREVYQAIARSYEMTRHTHGGAGHLQVLTGEFIDQFGIAGPPSHCVARLRALAELGIDRFLVIGLSSGGDADQKLRAQALLEKEVLGPVQQ